MQVHPPTPPSHTRGDVLTGFHLHDSAVMGFAYDPEPQVNCIHTQ